MNDKKLLVIPIWLLYNVKSLEEIKYDTILSNTLKDGYDLGIRKGIYKTLKWAKENPSFEFKNLMKDAPVVGDLVFSNEEIYSYLIRFKIFMEREEYKLLTDDRARKNT